MKNLLRTATACVDAFCKQEGLTRHAAIVGGEAVILHGIPRTTIDIDILLTFMNQDGTSRDCTEELARFLRESLEKQCQVEAMNAASDPDDPLKHDIIILTDRKREFKKLDILMANFEWEMEGFRSMTEPCSDPLQPYPKPYLVGMKLMAGGPQDMEDIRGLLITMNDEEKDIASRLAEHIGRDRNLNEIIGSFLSTGPGGFGAGPQPPAE